MIIDSNPFLLNDCCPDRIEQLENKIVQVQSGVDLLSKTVDDKSEYINERVNALQNSYKENFITDNLTANMADINILNVNTQATVNTLNVNNLYTEYLRVNKPIFDVTLNNPHTENMTSLNGNFYNMQINGAVLTDLTTTNPITSSALVGYDKNGHLIPVSTATAKVELPYNADYIYTDAQGFAQIGKAESVTGATNNLITAWAVKNVVDTMENNLETISDTFEATADALNRRYNWTANDINNVNNTINNINSGLNSINTEINNLYNQQGQFTGIYIPEYGTFNATSPVDYTNATTTQIYGTYNSNFTSIPGGGGAIYFDNTTNKVTFAFSGASRYITDASNMFNGCSNLTTPPTNFSGITNAKRMFFNCRNMNIMTLDTGETIQDACGMFGGCNRYNAITYIGNNVTDTSYMFNYCTGLNKPVLFHTSIADPNIKLKNASFMFYCCPQFNQVVNIPYSVTNTNSMFRNCSLYNRETIIPNNVTDAYGMFMQSTSMNSNVTVGKNVNTASCMFKNCSNFNAGVSMLYSNVKNLAQMFNGCSSYNQIPIIPYKAENCQNMFDNCISLNRSKIYIYSININEMHNAFNCPNIFPTTTQVYIPAAVPKDTNNYIYNCLVNGYCGKSFISSFIYNNL